MARLLAALLAWMAGVSMTTFAGAPVQDPARPPKFSHAQHVDDKWFSLGTAEVWRDCRGCHRFDAQHEVSAPQRECDSCHAGTGLLQRQFTKGWEDDLGGYRTRTRDAFRHHTHYMLECRECHLPPTTNNLTDFDVVTGPGQCERCHEQRDAAAGAAVVKRMRWFRAVADADVARDLGVAQFPPPAEAGHAEYADKLVKVFAGPEGGINTTPLPRGGDFDHDDHAEIGCTDCHAGIPRAAAKDVGTGQIPTDKCGKCHIVDAAGKAATAAPAPEPQQRTLHSLGAFVHADHYRFLQQGAQRRTGVCTEQAYAQLTDPQQNSCNVCHIQDPAAVGLVQPDFPFEKGNSKHTYLDCAGCHDVDGWRTGETASKPFHDSSDGAEDGKNGWGACTACHVPGQGAMAKARPMIAVARRTESTFRFTTHTHPYITSAASTRAQIGDCAKCHRARVPELPTRLEQRVFRHDTHLPAGAQAKDCTGCHPSATSALTGPSLAIDFRTYSTKDCTTCHVGGDVTEVIAGDAVPASRMVVQFPHGPHVTAGVSCTDCHELAGGADVATKPAALSCSQCHDHRPDEPGKPAGPKAEGLFGGEALSCVRCHHEPAPPGGKPVEAVPHPRGTPGAAADARHRIETTAFAGFAQNQFHPLGGQCTECHKANLAPDRRYTGIKRKRADHIFAQKGKVHGAGPKRPENCLACHWSPAKDFKSAVSMSTQELRELRSEPASKATRERFGNKRKDYPGEKADG